MNFKVVIIGIVKINGLSISTFYGTAIDFHVFCLKFFYNIIKVSGTGFKGEMQVPVFTEKVHRLFDFQIRRLKKGDGGVAGIQHEVPQSFGKPVGDAESEYIRIKTLGPVQICHI